MSLLSWFLAVLNWLSNFLIIQLGGFNPFRLQEVTFLLLCQDMSWQAQMNSLYGDEGASMNSWVYINGNIKYKFFYIGGPQIARRVWRDYGRMDAVVYLVNADAILRGDSLRAGDDLIDLMNDEAFVEVPFIIFGLGGFNPSRLQEVTFLLLCQDMSWQAQMNSLYGDEGASMNSWVYINGNIKYKFFYIGGPQIAQRVWRDYGRMDAVVYLVNADAILRGDSIRAGEDLIDLINDEAFVEVPFIIFGVRFLEALLNTRERRERSHYFLLRGFLG